MENNVETLEYSYKVGGGHYTISKTIVLPKKIESAYLRIEDWSNKRMLYFDKKNNVSYFQASSESNECHRCSLCQKRMKSIGWKTGHDFVYIKGHCSVYQVLKGVPSDTTPGTLSKFLGLPVV